MDPFNTTQADDEEFVVEHVETNDNPPWILKPGWYVGKLVNAEKAKSKAGNPMIIWEFLVGDDNIRHYTALTPSAIGMACKVIKSLGMPMAADGVFRFKKSAVINKTCAIYVENETYNEKMQNKIAEFDTVENQESNLALDARDAVFAPAPVGIDDDVPF